MNIGLVVAIVVGPWPQRASRDTGLIGAREV